MLLAISSGQVLFAHGNDDLPFNHMHNGGGFMFGSIFLIIAIVVLYILFKKGGLPVLKKNSS